VALLGAAGAVALLAYCQQVYRQLGGTEGGAELAPSVWAALVAPVVPVGAALLAPRRFGVAVLLGWVGGGTAIFLSSYSVYRRFRGEGSDIDGRPILAYGLTLLALLVVTGLLARVAQTSRAEPAAGG
jgi:hypothetical protein